MISLSDELVGVWEGTAWTEKQLCRTWDGGGELRWCFSWNSVSDILGVCLTESGSDLVLTTERAERTCLLPSCAWGCPRTLGTSFPPVSASGKVLRCSHVGGTDLSHLTFPHKLSSCVLPRPYLPPSSPLTPAISPSHVPLLLSRAIFVWKPLYC